MTNLKDEIIENPSFEYIQRVKDEIKDYKKSNYGSKGSGLANCKVIINIEGKILIIKTRTFAKKFLCEEYRINVPPSFTLDALVHRLGTSGEQIKIVI